MTSRSLGIILVTVMAILTTACGTTSKPAPNVNATVEAAVKATMTAASNPGSSPNSAPSSTATAVPDGGSNQAYFPPTAVPTEVPKELFVMHTDGQGVYLRSAPDGARTKVFAENTRMMLTGQSDSSTGTTWYEVSAPDGSKGWVSSKYLDMPPPPTPTPDRSRYQLELVALTAKRSSDWYVTVEGQVKNLSSASIRSVEAVVQWYTADDKFITSDSSIIDYNPILSGQTSPFKVLTRYNPQMGRYRIDFKTFMGGTITMLDSTKR